MTTRTPVPLNSDSQLGELNVIFVKPLSDVYNLGDNLKNIFNLVGATAVAVVSNGDEPSQLWFTDLPISRVRDFTAKYVYFGELK